MNIPASPVTQLVTTTTTASPASPSPPPVSSPSAFQTTTNTVTTTTAAAVISPLITNPIIIYSSALQDSTTPILKLPSTGSNIEVFATTQSMNTALKNHTMANNHLKYYISHTQPTQVVTTKNANQLVNSNIMRANIQTTNNTKSPSPPPILSTQPTAISVIPQPIRTINLSKLSKFNSEDGTTSTIPSSPSPPQANDDQINDTNTNLITNKGSIINARKIIRTTPPPITTISTPVQQQQSQQSTNHISIQNITKKPTSTVNINTVTSIATGSTATSTPNLSKQLNTITLVNNSNILNAAINSLAANSASTLSSSYIASCSNSPQINLPITTLSSVTPVQLSTTSTASAVITTTIPTSSTSTITSTPTIINSITKCSQSFASSSSIGSSSSGANGSSITGTVHPTLGPTATAKLILTGSVNTVPNSQTVGNNIINLMDSQLALKLTSNNQPIIKNLNSPSSSTPTTNPSQTTPQTQKILVSTPIQIHHHNQTATSNILIPRFTSTNVVNGSNLTLHQLPLTTSSTITTTTTSTLTTTSATLTPINIKSLNNSKLNDTLNKSSIIKTNLNNYVKTTTPTTATTQIQRTTVNSHLQDAISTSKQNESTTSTPNLINIMNPTNTSHMQISQLLNQTATARATTNTQQAITLASLANQSQSPSSSPMKPNIIRKTKSSFDARDPVVNININHAEQLNTETQSTQHGSLINEKNQAAKSGLEIDNNQQIVDIRSVINNKNDVVKVSSTTIMPPSSGISTTQLPTSNQKAQSKKIVNISKCSPSISGYASSSSQASSSTSLKLQQVGATSIQLQQNVAQALLSSVLPQQATIIHVPSNLTVSAAQNTIVPSTGTSSSAYSSSSSTVIQLTPENSQINLQQSSTSPPPTPQNQSQLATLTSSARKRRKQEFKKSLQTEPVSTNPFLTKKLDFIKKENVNEEADENNNKNLNNEYDHENDNEIKVFQKLNENSENDDDDDDNKSDISSQPPKKITRFSNLTPKVKLKKGIKKESYDEPIHDVDNKNVIETKSENKINKFQLNVLDDETVKNLSKEFVYCDRYGVQWRSKKVKQSLTLTKYFKPTWKSRQNHYVKYSDVKIKEETKALNDLVIEKDRLKNLNEWKFHYVISQFNELRSFENESLNLINEIENLIKTNTNVKDTKIYETIKANSQRHIYINEQLNEAHLLIQNLFQHKQKYYDILNRTSSQSNSNSTTSSSTSINNNNNNNNTNSNNKIDLKVSSTSKTALSKRNNNNLNTKDTNNRNSPLLKRKIKKTSKDKNNFNSTNNISLSNR